MDMDIRMVDVWTVFTSGFLSSALLRKFELFLLYLKASEADPFLLFCRFDRQYTSALTNYLAGKVLGKA